MNLSHQGQSNIRPLPIRISTFLVNLKQSLIFVRESRASENARRGETQTASSVSFSSDLVRGVLARAWSFSRLARFARQTKEKRACSQFRRNAEISYPYPRGKRWTTSSPKSKLNINHGLFCSLISFYFQFFPRHFRRHRVLLIYLHVQCCLSFYVSSFFCAFDEIDGISADCSL